MERRPSKSNLAGPWREYLRDSLAANKPWDQLVREILSSDGSDPKTFRRASQIRAVAPLIINQV